MPDPRPPASPNLVTTDWLAARLGEPEISIVDGSLYLPALKRDAKAEFAAGHVPGAISVALDHKSAHLAAGAATRAFRFVFARTGSPKNQSW